MRAADLTQRQYRVLAYMFEHFRSKGRPPSFREICQRFGFASTGTVRTYFDAFQRKGYVKRTGKAVQLNLERVWQLFGIPIIGKVAAGKPILAEENFERALTPDDLFPKEKGVFALRIKGDSMRDAGVLDGDLVIVREQETAKPGEIVVAILGDEATVKRLVREKGREYLVPANPAYPKLPLDGWRVVGRVIQVVRKL
jgi:repressor LexA